MSEEPDNEENILIENMSPNGNVMAFAEATPDVVHFYLSGHPDTNFGMRAPFTSFDVANHRAGAQNPD